jgi:hypothetical protein
MASSNISSGLLAGCRLHVPGLLSPIRPSRPSLAVGGLFVANYFVFQAIAWLGGLNQATLAAFDEVKETNYAFAFFVLGLRSSPTWRICRGACGPSDAEPAT